MTPHREDAILGCLLGAAVGDALGLPMEGLSKRRQRTMYPDISGYQFLFGKGMVSDDTEHICMVAQALAKSEGDDVLFEKKLAWALRKWLICLPPGVGFATLKSCLKLWLGFSAKKSGVFSAGNGPAMRSAILGFILVDQVRTRLQHIREIRALRFTRGKLEVRNPETEKWISGDTIRSFRKRSFAYADPWRPFTAGYVGIEIRIEDVKPSAEDLFAYGLEEQRDQVFDYIEGLCPEKAVENKSS